MSHVKGVVNCVNSIMGCVLELGLEVSVLENREEPNSATRVSWRWDEGRAAASDIIWPALSS